MFRDRNPEYDPGQVYVPQRPLATTKSPQKQQADGSDGQADIRPPSPSKDQASPAKSSLSRASRFGAVNGAGFDPESEIWSDSRNAKSVTFDAAPPQVNEYEMTTPDPSSTASESREGSFESAEEEEEDEEVDTSFDRDSSAERDDSFDASLEDTEKTPVVLPDEWRYREYEDYTEDEEEEENHGPDPRPSSRGEPPKQHSRVESLDSNGEPRPLPPLPSVLRSQASQPVSSPGKYTTTALELASGGQRSLPTPPGPATFTKSDIAEFSNASMSLEDRLRLMAIQDERKDAKPSEHNTHDEKDIKPDDGHQETVENKETDEKSHDSKDADEGAEQGDEVFSPPRISRDSILRDIRKGSFDDDDSEMDYDPDVPIPSLENNEYTDDDTDSVIIKEEEDDNDDLYDIPEYYENVSSKDSSYKDLNGKLPHDESSHYSLHSGGAVNAHPPASQEPDDGYSTPVPGDRTQEVPEKVPSVDNPKDASREDVTQEDAAQRDISRENDTQEDATQEGDTQGGDTEKEPEQARPPPALDMSAIRETLQRPVTSEAEAEQVSEPSTPDSVIRHPVEDDEESDISADESVPAPIATVKAPGTGLKTRPSLTPADLESMAATRRKVSGPQLPPVPFLRKDEPNDSQQPAPEDTAPQSEGTSNQLAPPSPNKDNQRQSSLVKLDIPISIQEESLGFGLNKEFDRVMENQKVAFELALSQCSSFRPRPVTYAQDPFISTLGPEDPSGLSHPYSGTSANHCTPKQRGYLMRQNTKVIVASSHNEEETATTPGEAATEARVSRTPGNSNRKPSQQTWTTVPWNSQRRRSSIRTPSGIPKKKPVPGAVPPLPGQQSNVQEPAAAVEEAEPGLNEALDEGEERGRLFVKVVGIKYLDMPLPRGRFSYD